MSDTSHTEGHTEGIAIVGMAGRFPGANDVAQFWENIKGGVESVTKFPASELEIDIPDAAGDKGAYVCAKGMLDDIDMFDARFFGYLPREAEVMDPQHRMFLEICWEAMEHAGHDAERYPGAVGVFGGCYMDTYVLHNLCSDETFRERLVESIQVGTLQTELGNDKDYLATRVAYKLGLRGPAITMQTACSTSLVAIATACQSLDGYQCDMALAGGVTIILPQKKGYFYKEGGMLSPDGHCRTFDENAAGTVFSHGAAVVLLKRVADAIADGDTIYGVLRGYATNNDGGDKVSYTAPSVEGQAEVISLALGLGGVDPATIGYVEAHGTATPLGDPIEVGGLTNAYRRFTDEKQYCAIGSVKANLGHLDVASGAIGLIKTTLALHEKTLPPQINFSKPNPKIDFAASPFYVNTELKAWPEGAGPRRAAVSSFGVGGTNAHVVVEEAPVETRDGAARGFQLLPLSARSETALAAQAEQLAAHLEKNPTIDFADAAYTWQVGRRAFDHRRIVVAQDAKDAIEKLRGPAAPSDTAKRDASAPDLVFMFPGQGAQYPGMGRALYFSEEIFRATIDEISDTLHDDPHFGVDLRDYILWSDESPLAKEDAVAALTRTELAQPAIFAVEMALANQLIHWGATPSALIGHSVGEIAAAAVSGVFSLGDAARLVAARGRAMQHMAPGSMLAVLAPLADVEPKLSGALCVAAINAPNATVVSGPADELETFVAELERDGVKSTVLATSHAFHSSMMDGARAEVEMLAAAAARHEGAIEIFSTESSKAGAAALADPLYWGRQLMHPVRFADAVSNAAARFPHAVFVEVGPGQALTSFARQTLMGEMKRPVVSSLGPQRAPGDDVEHLVAALGRLWMRGATPDWRAFQIGERRRIALPTYPFERKRFWVEPTRGRAHPQNTAVNQPQMAAVETSTPAASSSGADVTEMEDLVRRQLALIAAQLAAMEQK
ncbi:MAG: type I polyketide synthase [Pseudomonadota bacterium]